jgi:4-oxalmesaconate hydratase
MIIDCHGHYTTAPAKHDAWREAQTAGLQGRRRRRPAYPDISDDEIRETIETNQLRLLKERGADMTIFSPRASTMAHHVGDEAVSQAWTRRCNDLIKRVVDLYPRDLHRRLPAAAVAGRVDRAFDRRAGALRERAGLRRLQPQPRPVGRPLDRPAPDRPGLVSLLREDGRAGRAGHGPRLRQCNHNFHATGAHYINADTTAFMQFLEGDLFADFPTCGSSSRTAAARCPITGAAIAAWPTC